MLGSIISFFPLFCFLFGNRSANCGLFSLLPRYNEFTFPIITLIKFKYLSFYFFKLIFLVKSIQFYFNVFSFLRRSFSPTFYNIYYTVVAFVRIGFSYTVGYRNNAGLTYILCIFQCNFKCFVVINIIITDRKFLNFLAVYLGFNYRVAKHITAFPFRHCKSGTPFSVSICGYFFLNRINFIIRFRNLYFNRLHCYFRNTVRPFLVNGNLNIIRNLGIYTGYRLSVTGYGIFTIFKCRCKSVYLIFFYRIRSFTAVGIILRQFKSCIPLSTLTIDKNRFLLRVCRKFRILKNKRKFRYGRNSTYPLFNQSSLYSILKVYILKACGRISGCYGNTLISNCTISVRNCFFHSVVNRAAVYIIYR